MNKTEVINNFFKTRNIRIETLKQKVLEICPQAKTCVIYVSQLDGLGSKLSDVDIYALTDETITSFSKQIRINNIDMDIEIWSSSELEEKGNNLNDQTLLDIGKILNRMMVGKYIIGKKSDFNCLISHKDLMIKLKEWFISSALSSFDDAKMMRNLSDIEAAEVLIRKAVFFLLGAHLANKNFPVFKEKWIPKIIHETHFLNDEELYEKYYSLFIKINIIDLNVYVDDIFQFFLQLFGRFQLD